MLAEHGAISEIKSKAILQLQLVEPFTFVSEVCCHMWYFYLVGISFTRRIANSAATRRWIYKL